ARRRRPAAHAAGRGGRPGGRDQGVRGGAHRPLHRPGRHLRRAVHHGARDRVGRPRGRGRRRRRPPSPGVSDTARRLALLAVLVAAVVAGARGIQWIVSDLGADTTAPAADPHGAAIRVVIPPGADASEIGAILEDQGVVADGGRFREYAKDQGEGSDFKAGAYTMRAGTGYDALIRALDRGPVEVTKTLVIPEGYRITDIQARLPAVGISKQAYARAVRRAVPPPGYGHHLNMEGFMFPATYTIRPGEKAAALVDQQLAAFQANVSKVDMSYAKSKNLTPYDVLTIASMIGREARAPGDRAKVAAVIYNRLHRGMALGIDATI